MFVPAAAVRASATRRDSIGRARSGTPRRSGNCRSGSPRNGWSRTCCRTPTAEGPAYDLDLTGAMLEYFDLSGRRIGGLLLRYAALHSSTNLSGCRFTGRAYFTAAGTGSRPSGRLFRCRGAQFLEATRGSAVRSSPRTPTSPRRRSPGRPRSRTRCSRRTRCSPGWSRPANWTCAARASRARPTCGSPRCRSRVSLYNTQSARREGRQAAGGVEARGTARRRVPDHRGER